MKKRNVSYLLIYLLLATITLTASVLAWHTLSKDTDIGGINSNIPNFSKMITFDVKRKGESEYTKIKTIDDMHLVFGNTAPGETYEFKIDIDNQLTRQLEVSLYLPKFLSSKNPESNEDPIVNYNILDVFYIDQGAVNVNNFNRLTNAFINTYTETLDENDGSIVNKHDQVLNNYRINNLINDVAAINLISLTIPVDTKAIITFTFVYDEQTVDNNYQDLMLSFDGIYIFSEQVG